MASASLILSCRRSGSTPTPLFSLGLPLGKSIRPVASLDPPAFSAEAAYVVARGTRRSTRAIVQIPR
jgi:hypothetical protein